MPTRPRSHRIEDISIRRFEDALPEGWLSRKRSHDYGIDLEIEVFDDADQSTGDIFYAQVRATDSADQYAKITIKIDQLEYFRSLDIPTLIVRYNAVDGSIFYKWHFDVDMPATDQKTLTVPFDASSDIWMPATGAEILATLRASKALRSLDHNRPLPIRVSNSLSSISKAYEFSRACDRIASSTPVIVRSTANENFILEVVAREEGVAISIDRLASIRIDHDYDDQEQLFSILLYALVFICHQVGLQGQAGQLADLALTLEVKATARPLAAQASAALVDRPQLAVELAKLNDLAAQQDEFLVGLVAGIHRSSAPRIAKLRAARDLYEDAIARGFYDDQPIALSAVFYSYGNVCRSLGDFRMALRAYSKSQKLRPEYYNSAYFCGEVAGCLFLSRRYSLSSAFYRMAYDINPSPITLFLLGDALLMSGRPKEAGEAFQGARSAEAFPIEIEAQIKAELCNWLTGKYGETFSRRSSLAMSQTAQIELHQLHATGWQNILDNVDPLDALSNFNAARAPYDEGDLLEAYYRYLVVAFAQPGDAEAWHNATVCVIRTDTARFIATLSLALWQCGREPYELLRKKILDSNPDDPLLADLDRLADDLVAQGNHDRFESLTVRLFRDDAFDAVFEVPPPSTV